MNKREKALQKIEYFIPSNVDWSHIPSYALSPLKLTRLREDPQGADPEDAFFSISERGKYPDSVKDLGRLASLISGQRWMAAHIKMWKEGFTEGTLLREDFDTEPLFIQQIVPV